MTATTRPKKPADKRAQKAERVHVRLTAAAKRTLAHAAEVSGRSVSDFVVDSALRAAQETIRERQTMRLTERDRNVFLKALTDPPEPGDALRKAVARYKELGA